MDEKNKLTAEYQENGEPISAADELFAYAERVHSKCRMLMRIGLYSFFGLPVVLFTLRSLADIDKVVNLLIWIVCMFILAGFLIYVSYFDKRLNRNISHVKDERARQKHGDLMIVEPIGPIGKHVMEFDPSDEKVREVLDEE